MEQIQMPNPGGQIVSRPGISASGNEAQGTGGMSGMFQSGQDANGMMNFKGLLQGAQLMQEKELLSGMTKEQEQTLALLAAGMQNVTNVVLPDMQNNGTEPGIPGNVAESIVSIQTLKLGQTERMTAEVPGTDGQMPDAAENSKAVDEDSIVTLEQTTVRQDESLKETGNVALKSKPDDKEVKETKETAELADAAVGKTGVKAQAVSERTDVQTTTTQDVMKAADPQEIPTNLADKILEKAEKGVREFEIQIEPKHLGKIAVKVEYHEGQAAISIICSESKTLEILKQNVDDISHIVQKNLQEETIVYVDEKKTEHFEQQGNGNNDAGRESEWERQKEERRRRSRSSANRFLQELRLGLLE